MNSMTGYGQNELVTEAFSVHVELKSVNNRFLDIQFRMPREFNALELEMKQYAKSLFSRGRVDCFITVKKDTASFKQMTIHWDMLDSLVNQLSDAQKSRYKAADISVDSLLTGAVMHSDLVEVTEKDGDNNELIEAVLSTFKAACKALSLSRSQEGAHLSEFLLTYLDDSLKLIEVIKVETENTQAEHRSRLDKKVSEVLGHTDIDHDRILTEVTLLVEKGDIQEEIDRLSVHMVSLRELLSLSTPIGKEMDFLIQEMNREVNTIGSKSNSIVVKEAVVQLKTIIEKMREQVQNIE